MSRRDYVMRDLFEVPVAPAPVPASMDYRQTVSHLLADMLIESGLDRYEIAARASRLAGKDISKYMLDAYTAASREEFNLPAWVVPVLEAVCDSHKLSNWLAATRGARLFVGKDALAAELGRIERQRDALRDQAQSIKHTLQRASK